MTNAKRLTHRIGSAACLLALVVLTACASAPEEAKREPALFYPSPPAPARLQYLTRYSTQLDLGAKNDAFNEFVWGKETVDGHLVKKPYGLAIFEGAIYVVDTRKYGYAIFDLASGRARIVTGNGPSVMKKPINITIDSDGTRYITDTKREQILVFDREDRFLRALGKPGQFRPVDVVVDGDRLYVTDILHHQIHILNKYSGLVLSSFGSVGGDPGELFQPTNLALGPEGTLYVTDTGNFRVQEFSLEGEFIRDIGQIGTVAGQFARPKGIAVDRESRLYVVDAAFENIQILDQDGTSLLFFAEPGENRGNINMPTVVKIDYDNLQYFRRFVDPGFELEYVVLVASQFGLNKVVVYGFGSMRDEDANGAQALPQSGDQ
jgi:sugar lactone lactonase YvrE